MGVETIFEIGSPDYAVRWLSLEDTTALQELFDKCLDYLLLVDGQGPAAHAAEEEFRSVPDGRSPDDKFLLGIVNQRANLIGFLEGLRHHPDEKTWWIGLLLLAPEIRGQGIGHKVVQGFCRYARMRGCQAIMLGVVDDNERAYEFWKRLGFELLHKTEPRRFGNKSHAVRVMRRMLVDH